LRRLRFVCEIREGNVEKIIMKKRKKFCPPTPRKTNKFKIIVFLVLAPFIAWYSKQSSNNPWQMRSEYFFEKLKDNSALVFFQQNSNKKSDFLRVYLSDNPPIFDTIQLFVSNNNMLKYNIDNQIDTIHRFSKYGWIFNVKDWGVLIKSDETNIIVSFNDTIAKNLENSILCDVLVSSANLQKMKDERLFFRPRLTIWLTDEKEVPQISNIYIPKTGEKFWIKKSREKLAISPIE